MKTTRSRPPIRRLSIGGTAIPSSRFATAIVSVILAACVDYPETTPSMTTSTSLPANSSTTGGGPETAISISGSSESGVGDSPPVCQADGDCPIASRNYCDDGLCVGCQNLEPSACTARDPTLPICNVTSGQCVQCVSDEHCDGLRCDSASGRCGAGGSDSDIAVVVGYGGRRARSVDGLVWEHLVELDSAGTDDMNLLRGVGYGEGTFVAVGGAADGAWFRSFDGIEWDPGEGTVPRAFMSDVVWFNGGFVSAGGNGLRVRSTDLGLTWGDDTGFYAGHYRAIEVGDDRVVAVGHTGEQIGLWSVTTDGTTWTSEQTGGSPLWGLAFGNGVFVTVGNAGRVSASSDGASWQDQVIGTANHRTVAFAAGQFILATDTGYALSADGVEWTMEEADPRDVSAYFNGRYLSVGAPAGVFAASELGAWEPVFELGGSAFTQIAVGAPGR